MMKKYLSLLTIIFSVSLVQAQSPEQNLKSLGIELPKASTPLFNYVKFVRTGNLIYLSGTGPGKPDGTFITGKVGRDLSIEEGAAAAKLTGINLIATLQNAIGDLGKVTRIVKVFGMVNCTENFTDQPKVINGFSDLMVAVFGDKGRHARSAVGMFALPMNIAVEIEMIVEVSDQ
jgi:enamine deaminase RidA (YjgF/YER057c/UK114 family)